MIKSDNKKVMIPTFKKKLADDPSKFNNTIVIQTTLMDYLTS